MSIKFEIQMSIQMLKEEKKTMYKNFFTQTMAFILLSYLY